MAIPESITTDLWLITEALAAELNSEALHKINCAGEVFNTVQSSQCSTWPLKNPADVSAVTALKGSHQSSMNSPHRDVMGGDRESSTALGENSGV